ncbi:MAG: hypothetical protein JST43_05275 [Bacteroidetes bacterium]|nr:hypothetical protein [Bacteroidota bacterium]MBS1540972.1 hypothetical protein [Bacteroidota bacterium]
MSNFFKRLIQMIERLSLKAMLFLIGIGIWIIVFQNAGIIPTKQNVYVKGGYINWINNPVHIVGEVSTIVGNTVDINIQEINGQRNVFFNNPKQGDKDKFYLLPVVIQ